MPVLSTYDSINQKLHEHKNARAELLALKYRRQLEQTLAQAGSGDVILAARAEECRDTTSKQERAEEQTGLNFNMRTLTGTGITGTNKGLSRSSSSSPSKYTRRTSESDSDSELSPKANTPTKLPRLV